MFNLKPTTRKEAGHKLSKYDQLMKEFEESGLSGVKMEMESRKKANNTTTAINVYLRRNNKGHIECFAKDGVVYLFNTILEKGEEK